MSEGRKTRERKTVERFTPGEAVKEQAKPALVEGKGTKLGEIPNVGFKLEKLKGTDELMETLHTVLFKSKGKANSRKKDIKAFSGFVHEGDETEESKKVVAKLGKLTLPQLHSIMDVLDIPRGSAEDGTKDKKVERLAKFLEKPEVLSDKDLRAQAEKKKGKAKTKGVTKRAASAKKPASAKKSEKDATAASPKTATTKAASSKTPVKKTEKAKTPAKKADKAKTPAKKAGEAKTPAKKAQKAQPTAKKTETKKRKAADAEEKPAKKAKKEEKAASGKLPEDAIIVKDAGNIIQTAVENQQDISLKFIYAQLGEKYSLDIADIKKKKDIIKLVVEEYTNGSPEKKADGGEQEGPVAEIEPTEAAAEQPKVTEPPSAAPSEVKAASEPPKEAEEVTHLEAATEQPPAEPMDIDPPTVEEPDDPVVRDPATFEGDETTPPEAPAAEPVTEPVVVVDQIAAVLPVSAQPESVPAPAEAVVVTQVEPVVTHTEPVVTHTAEPAVAPAEPVVQEPVVQETVVQSVSIPEASLQPPKAPPALPATVLGGATVNSVFPPVANGGSVPGQPQNFDDVDSYFA